MSYKPTRISIVIVNYNTKDLLGECLNSLLVELQDVEHEVIVVDNASTDGSQETVKRNFPEIVFVQNKENVGFPKANNQVLLRCLGEYIMLLNPDTLVLPGSIRKMIDFLDNNEEYGAVGPKIMNRDGTIQMECASSFPTLWGLFFEMTQLSRIFYESPMFGGWKMTHWDHLDSRDVECLLGAAILTRRTILNEIGLLDEHMYVEDVDLCFRIRTAGWRIRYLSTADLIHYGGASRECSKRFYHHYQIAWQGLWHFFRKHRGSAQAKIFCLMAFFCSMIGLIFFFPISWLTFFDKKLSLSFQNKGKKAWAIFSWSIISPRRFTGKY